MLALNKQFLLAEAGLVRETSGRTTLQAVYSPLFDTVLAVQQVRDADLHPYVVMAATRRGDFFHPVAFATTYNEAIEKFTRAGHRFKDISRKDLLSADQLRRATRKAYAWEGRCLSNIDNRISIRDFTLATRQCARLMGRPFPEIEYGKDEKVPVDGLLTRESASYSYEKNRILVPAPMRTPVTSAHEMTHSVLEHTQKGEPHLFHGPAFIRLSAILYHRQHGASLQDMIEEAKRENIWGLDPESRTSRRTENLAELCRLPDKEFLSELKQHVLFREFV